MVQEVEYEYNEVFSCKDWRGKVEWCQDWRVALGQQGEGQVRFIDLGYYVNGQFFFLQVYLYLVCIQFVWYYQKVFDNNVKRKEK